MAWKSCKTRTGASEIYCIEKSITAMEKVFATQESFQGCLTFSQLMEETRSSFIKT